MIRKTFTLNLSTTKRLEQLSIQKNVSQSNIVDVAVNLLNAYLDKSPKNKTSIVKFTRYKNGKTIITSKL